MQFFIALAILIAASSAYLLHQFWSRSLSATEDAQAAGVPTADDQSQPGRLKAA